MEKAQIDQQSFWAEETHYYAELEHLDRERRLSHELLRPFSMQHTRILLDGNQWCILYGDNLQDGGAGFGDSPDLASRDFDRAWYKVINQPGLKEST